MPGYMETGGSRSCQRHAQTQKPLSVGRSFRTSQVRSRKPKPRTHKAGRCPLRPTATELSRVADTKTAGVYDRTPWSGSAELGDDFRKGVEPFARTAGLDQIIVADP